MARVLVSEKIADGGLDALRAAGHDVDVQLGLSPEELILAVKGATKHRILESFAERVGNAPAVEFENALGQIARIFRFRIEDRVSPD